MTFLQTIYNTGMKILNKRVPCLNFKIMLAYEIYLQKLLFIWLYWK
jgi:hypothetical protein